MKVLVLGGAGYIGSHMVAYLQSRNIASVVIDDLTTSAKQAKQVLGWQPQYTQLQEIITHAWAREQKLSGL